MLHRALARRMGIVGCVAFALAGRAACEDLVWPGFRGNGASGIAKGKNLPERWSETENIAWKIAVPGFGWSCPVVAGKRVFLTTAIPDNVLEEPKKGLYFGRSIKIEKVSWEVHCFDAATGKREWHAIAHNGKPPRPIHNKNSYASETPVTDGKRVYAYFGPAGLHCYSVEGKKLWEQQFGAYPMRFGWGTASSPVLEGERLFIQYDNEEKGKSFVLALDAASGKELWKQVRDETSSWATPFVWKTASRVELVTAASKRIRSYDPETGKLLWEMGGMSSIAVPTPIAGPDFLYVSSGYVMDTKRPIFAIRPNANGDLTLAADKSSGPFVAWANKLAGPYMPTPIVYDGLLYVLYDRGLLACFDAKTGAVVYEKKRLGGSATAVTSCPWAYNGKIFCASEDGDTYVVRAGREFEVLGKNSLNEFTMATPAVAHDAVYFRTFKHLYRIGDSSAVAVRNPTQ